MRSSSLFSLLSPPVSLLSSLSALFPLLSSLSLLSSLFSRCCSFLRSHFALVPSNFASGHLSALFSLRSALLCQRGRPFSVPSRPSGTEPLPSRASPLDRVGRSLLASLCALPSSLAAARFPDRSSHLSLRTLHQAIEPAPNKPCQLSCCCSELERSALSALFSRLSPLPPLFPILSLLLISQISLRPCPFHLCIRPSTSHLTASTHCGSLPGPAECAKRLNPATEPSGRR